MGADFWRLIFSPDIFHFQKFLAHEVARCFIVRLVADMVELADTLL
jgi:hypothetical protein